MRSISLFKAGFSVMLVLVLTDPAAAAEVTITTPQELNDALEAAMDNSTIDTINIAAGIYTITSVLNYYDSDEADLAIIGAGAGVTILNGNNATQILHIDTTGGAGQTTRILLSDLTLRNGSSAADGGAVYVATNMAGLVVQRVEFITNTATDNGGGLYFTTTYGFMTVTDSLFDGNQAIGGINFPAGGGLWGRLNFGTEILVEDTEFTQNLASGGSGGGARFYSQGSGNITVHRCLFLDNTAGGSGGGVSTGVLGGDTEVINCLITGNSSTLGGGFHGSASSGTIYAINNTIVANSGTGIGDGGGIYLHLSTNASTGVLVNNIVFDNLYDSVSNDIYINDIDTPPNSVSVRYNDYEILASTVGSNVAVTDNISLDPQLVDAGGSDFRLSNTSPCIDAGDNSGITDTVDLAGNDRFTDDPDTADTGAGTAPIVDMGAYEFQPSGGGDGGGGGGGCATVGDPLSGPAWPGLMAVALMLLVIAGMRRKLQY